MSARTDRTTQPDPAQLDAWRRLWATLLSPPHQPDAPDVEEPEPGDEARPDRLPPRRPPAA